MTINPVNKCEGTYVPSPPALDPPIFEEPTNRPLPEIFQEVLDMDDVLSSLYAQISEANRRKEELLLEFKETAFENGYCRRGDEKKFVHKGKAYIFYSKMKPYYCQIELVDELK